ncbi:hypothetical protein BS17DRAFT_772950 [Gyrodon lividus]|nr:hypothetical protein BS17DRAFT_772950 [Gyrodon lividus]
MGVAGLWEVLRPAGKVRSLTELAVTDGFLANPSNQRGFRIGIDASIWFFHAAYGKEGENPELRTLFFRCCRLLQVPLLPLFVFDGPKRPAVKRGKRVGGNTHWLTQGMKNIIEAFGFEWRVAPGEAEAELAYLNRIGVIDAVLSDDVDNFLFGATMVIRNPSSTLSGNRSHLVKNAQGKDDGNHVLTYASSSILSVPSVALSCSGTILIALLSGGDYIPAGLPGCGQKFATGLARAGFGDSLVKAVKELKGARLEAFLDQWRDEVRAELRANKSGYLPSKKPSLAASFPDDFPSLPVLLSYVDPVISETEPLPKGTNRPRPVVWRNDPDPMRIAALCELYFEWGVKDVIVRRFRTVLWPGVVCRAVRRGVVDTDARGGTTRRGIHDSDDDEQGNPPGPLSPTKRISSTLSALALSSLTKSSLATTASTSDPQDTPFSLSSLVPLTSPASAHPSPSSTRSPSPSSNSPSPLLLSVLSHRTHSSTDATLEYRVLIDPTALVTRAESGVRGLRPPLVGGLFGVDPDGDGDVDDDEESRDEEDDGSGDIERLETAAAALKTKKRKPKNAQGKRESPTAPLRLWLPACMIRAVAPEFVEVYEEKVRGREKKAKRGARGATSRTTKMKDVMDDNDKNDDHTGPIPSSSKTSTKSKAKVVKVIGGVSGGGGRRRKPKQASEAQDEGYELIYLSAGEGPRSSDNSGSGYEGGMKGKGKGKGKVRAGAKDGSGTSDNTITKARAKTDATTASTNTVKEYFNTTKPFTMKVSSSKPFQPHTGKTSIWKTADSKHVPLYNELEADEDNDSTLLPPPLPKSSRPLDLLRSKSKSGPMSAPTLTTKPKPSSKLKSKSPIYEEEEISPSPSPPQSSKSNSSSAQSQLGKQSAPARKKPPTFVEVSDSDSDIEVSEVNAATSTVPAQVRTGGGGRVVSPTMVSFNFPNDLVDEKVVTGVQSIGEGEASSSLLHTRAVEGVRGVIDLARNGSGVGSRSKSAPSTHVLTPTPALLSHRSSSTSSGAGLASGLSSSAMAGTTKPTPIARSTSKLAHILLPSFLESEEEEGEGEGDELPTFHRGCASKFRTKPKGTSETTCIPVPRPFPMPSPFKSSLSYSPSRDRDNARAEGNGGDVEITDAFTSPCAPSPPRSPTPTPSPMKPPQTSGKSTDANEALRFPVSPTMLMAKQRPRAWSDSDSDAATPADGRDGTPKSPRKSVVHTSPRHVSRVRASSPTRPASPTGALWPAGRSGVARSSSRMSGARGEPAPATHPTGAGRRPRPSDESAIYISSGSEADEVEHDFRGVSVDGSHGDANTAMVLPSPPCLPSPTTHMPPGPAPPRASRFKAAVGWSLQTVVPTSLTDRSTAGEVLSVLSVPPTKLKDGTAGTSSKPLTRAPLLVARTKRAGSGMGGNMSLPLGPSTPTTTTTSASGSGTVAGVGARSRAKPILPDDDVIDLTSD